MYPTAVPVPGEAGGVTQGAGQLLGGRSRRQGSCGTSKASACVSGCNSARKGVQKETVIALGCSDPFVGGGMKVGGLHRHQQQ